MTEEEEKRLVLECDEEILRLIKEGVHLTYRNYENRENDTFRYLQMSPEEIRCEHISAKVAQEMNYHYRDKNE
jgi:hypothetical protein